MFKQLLVATDLCDGVHRLKDFASSLALGGVERLIVLHVVPLTETPTVPQVDSERVALAQRQLAQALPMASEDPGQADPGEAAVDLNPIPVEIVVESGRPTETILRIAQARGVDLIVLGTPTRNLLNEKLFGSTTMELCQRTSIPILALRPQLLYTYTREELGLRCRHLFRQLLIPYDGSEAARALVAELEDLGASSARRSQLRLGWVVDPVSLRGVPQQALLDQAAQDLAQMQADLAAKGFDVQVNLCQGTPVVEILQVAQAENISAIALSSGSLTASGGLGKLKQWSVPSFAAELLRRSWFPLLYLPPLK